MSTKLDAIGTDGAKVSFELSTPKSGIDTETGEIHSSDWADVLSFFKMTSAGRDVSIEVSDSGFVLFNEPRPRGAVGCELYPTVENALTDAWFDFTYGKFGKVVLRKQIGGGCLLHSRVEKRTRLNGGLE